ncbi:MAG: Gfo/Idh/MocA family oxidoreductase [Ruminococcaceae bacterium]|nr:Gfo/Idh/MocA family oxidoreductase [Oscillospiraceae bacterium]
MGKIKVGLVGAGNIAQSAHLPAYRALSEQAEVVAIADLNLQRAKDAAEKFNIPAAYASAEELLAGSQVDMVDVCVWNGSHAPVVMAAAAAGKPILCEKPMSDNLAHARNMQEAVLKANVPFMMAMVSRFSNEPLLLNEMVQAGELGDIYYAKTAYVRRRGTPLGWFTDRSKSGGGPVIDIGVHCIDRTWFLMGRPKPVRVSAAISRRIGNYQTKGVVRWVALDHETNVFDTEDSAAAIIHFANGASMLGETSWAINAKSDAYTQICGTKGGATLEPLTIYTENAQGYLTDNRPTVTQVNGFEAEISHFIDCLRTGKKPLAPLEDGIAIQKILQGIYDSAEQGREVAID